MVLAVTATHGYSADQATLHLELVADNSGGDPSALATDALWLAPVGLRVFATVDAVCAGRRRLLRREPGLSSVVNDIHSAYAARAGLQPPLVGVPVSLCDTVSSKRRMLFAPMVRTLLCENSLVSLLCEVVANGVKLLHQMRRKPRS